MGNIRRRKWIFSSFLWFCVFCHLLELNETVASGKIGSDERTALDQALLLVELLKSEYRKVLKENDELQAKNMLRASDVQTCATTTENPAQVTTSTKSHLVTELTTLSPALPFHRWNSRRKFNLFRHGRRHRRRHPPSAYFYYDIPRRFYDIEDYSGDQGYTGMGKMRRFAYDDFLGPQPSINHTFAPRFIALSSTTTLSSATTAVSTKNVTITSTSTHKAVSQPSSSRINSITTAKSDPIDSHFSKFTTATFQGSPNIEKVKKTSSTSTSSYSSTALVKTLTIDQNSSTESTSVLVKKLMISQRESKPKTISSRNVEFSQALSELAKEFGVGFGHRFVTMRGSTKVFLAGSTSYPRPLPENHPFCFTNPRSALCKTIV